MSLSGAEDEHYNRTFIEGLRNNYPHLADDYFLVSDSVGTILTALGGGGTYEKTRRHILQWWMYSKLPWIANISSNRFIWYFDVVVISNNL